MDSGDDAFGAVELKGERFKGGNLPVALLDNIKAYQNVLLDLAEEIWREKNPDRQRLPKNFRKNLSLSFSHVDDGSAVAVLKPDSSIEMGLLSDEYAVNYLGLAQTRFLDISRAANEDRPIDGVPAKARQSIKMLLSDLRKDETIEFVSRTGSDTRNPRVRFAQRTRDRILEGARDDRERNLSGIAIVRSIFDASEEIELLSEFGPVRVKVGREAIRKHEFPIARFCEFSVYAQIRANGQIKSVLKLNSVEPVDKNVETLRVQRKIEEFKAFREGWKNGQGIAIKTAAINFAEDLAGFICELYETVSIFPQTDGTISFQFAKGSFEVEITCTEAYVRVEALDEEMEVLNEQVFFGVSPKLLAAISDIEEFAR